MSSLVFSKVHSNASVATILDVSMKAHGPKLESYWFRASTRGKFLNGREPGSIPFYNVQHVEWPVSTFNIR